MWPVAGAQGGRPGHPLGCCGVALPELGGEGPLGAPGRKGCQGGPGLATAPVGPDPLAGASSWEAPGCVHGKWNFQRSPQSQEDRAMRGRGQQ